MKLIELTQGKFAKVDDEDFEELARYKWHYSDYGRTGYARRMNYKKRPYLLRMHCVLLCVAPPLMVDHINGDGLDNRKENLRVVSKSQNMMNRSIQKNSSSGYKGVSKCLGKWRAYIVVDRKQIHLGVFDEKINAAIAYNEAVVKYHGEYAVLNPI